MFIPIYAVHHSGTNWENPEEFLPDRFLDEEGEINSSRFHPFAYIPFGGKLNNILCTTACFLRIGMLKGGNRVCPGQALAQFEFKTILYTLIENFRIYPGGAKEGNRSHQPSIIPCGMFQDCVNNWLRFAPVKISSEWNFKTSYN